MVSPLSSITSTHSSLLANQRVLSNTTSIADNSPFVASTPSLTEKLHLIDATLFSVAFIKGRVKFRNKSIITPPFLDINLINGKYVANKSMTSAESEEEMRSNWDFLNLLLSAEQVTVLREQIEEFARAKKQTDATSASAEIFQSNKRKNMATKNATHEEPPLKKPRLNLAFSNLNIYQTRSKTGLAQSSNFLLA